GGALVGAAPGELVAPDYGGDCAAEILRGGGPRLYHFVTRGRGEGRRPLPVAASLEFDRSRLDPKLETVLLVAHEASRTGAPILTYNLAKRLRRQCNVVALLLAGGDILEDFQASCAAVIGPLTHVDWHPGEFKHLVKYTLAAYPVTYAIVNSIEASRIVPPLARALVPTVVLVHEFAGYVRPNSVMRGGLESGTQ